MTTDPKDAEIADLVAELTRAPGWPTLARRAVDTIKALTAERDAALAQVAGAYEAAAQEVGSWAGPSEDRMTTIRALTPADALTALSRRDAQMRAEGMRMAARLCEEDGAAWDWAGCRDAILAAAEKEVGNG